MSRRSMIPVLAAVVAMSALDGTTVNASGQAEERFDWSGTIPAGAAIEIKNVNGPVFAEMASGSEVEVVGIKEGPADDIAEVDIEVIEHADGVTICAVYPDVRGDDYECGPGNQGNLGSRNNKTRIDFTVRVPAGVRLVSKTMNGRLEARSLRSDVELLTMNGAIEVETTGWARAKTMNGSIEARLGSADWDDNLEIESMNGGIDLWLPADASAEVRASTMNGRVRSDWDLDTNRGWARSRARGTIGSGGRRLEVTTMNGSIRLRRSD